MPTYVLVTFLEDVPAGAEFTASAWPLHLTLLPNFSIAWDGSTLGERLRPVLTGRRPITVVASHEEFFGPRETIPVAVVETTPELTSLHRELHDMLAAAGAAFEYPAYVADGYRPHVTAQAHRRLGPGEEARLDTVSVVGIAPHGVPGRLKLLGTYALPARDNACETHG